MKKIIALMMALAMLLTVAGCGGSNNTASTASTPAADTAPAGDASTPAASAPAASAPSGDTSASPVAGKKVAYIMQMAPSDKMCIRDRVWAACPIAFEKSRRHPGQDQGGLSPARSGLAQQPGLSDR